MAAGEAGGEAGMRPGLSDIARQGWSWWVGELGALVPNALRARASARPAAIDCVLLPDGRIAAGLAGGPLPAEAEGATPGEALTERLTALAALARRRTVRLSVSRDLCLVRRVRLPQRALPHAGAILRHEAEALMPLDPDDILGDWYVETEDKAAGELDLVHVILSRRRVGAAFEACPAAGLTLSRLTVGDREGRPLPVDLLSRREPSLIGAVAGLSALAKALGAATILVVAATPYLASARQDAALEAMASARSTLPKQTPATTSAAAVADFLDAQARRPTLGEVLDEIALRLPRDVALTQFHLQGDRLTIGLAGGDEERAGRALSDLATLAPASATDMPGILAFTLRPRAFDTGAPRSEAADRP